MMQDAPPEYDLIEHLDWEETFPCEHSRHDKVHADEPATYMIKVTHLPCGYTNIYMICLSGWKRITASKTLAGPNHCGSYLPNSEYDFKILGVLV